MNHISHIKKDYLAIIHVGGGSTYGRDESIFEAVEGAVRICILDCYRYCQLEGKTLNVQVFDVTGRTELTWDNQGVYCTDTRETVDPLKVVTLQLPELTSRMTITGPKYLLQVTHEVSIACSQVWHQPSIANG